MINRVKKYLAATSEVLSVYVDLGIRKVVEFENEKANLINEFIEKNKNEFNPGELTLISKLKKNS